jgi:hypothetical protein
MGKMQFFPKKLQYFFFLQHPEFPIKLAQNKKIKITILLNKNNKNSIEELFTKNLKMAK